MDENTQVIIAVTFINGLIYALFQAWKSRRSVKTDNNGSGNSAK